MHAGKVLWASVWCISMYKASFQGRANKDLSSRLSKASSVNNYNDKRKTRIVIMIFWHFPTEKTGPLKASGLIWSLEKVKLQLLKAFALKLTYEL